VSLPDVCSLAAGDGSARALLRWPIADGGRLVRWPGVPWLRPADRVDESSSLAVSPDLAHVFVPGKHGL